jgi:hypothetical protein
MTAIHQAYYKQSQEKQGGKGEGGGTQREVVQLGYTFNTSKKLDKRRLVN